MSKKEIFKVQLSLFSNSPTRKVLIYNKDRSVEWEGEAGNDIIQLMDEEPKAFFYGKLENTVVNLGRPAPWQDW